MKPLDVRKTSVKQVERQGGGRKNNLGVTVCKATNQTPARSATKN